MIQCINPFLIQILPTLDHFSMDLDQILKSGYLYMHVPSFLKLKQSWIKRFAVLFKRSLAGVQRLEIFENQETFGKKSNSPIRMIPLNECHKLAESPHKHQQHVFEIRSKDFIQLLSAETLADMNEWLNLLRSVAFEVSIATSNIVSTHNHDPTPKHRLASATSYTCNRGLSTSDLENGVAKKLLYSNGPILKAGDSSVDHSLSSNTSDDCVVVIQHEENTLYSSLDAPQVFRVKLVDSEAVKRCNLAADVHYFLVLTSMSIALAEELQPTGIRGKVLWTWPYRHIRRYGCTKEGFSMEAGRKCLSGEGLFSFVSNEGGAIFKCVANHVNNLKVSQTGEEDQLLIRAIIESKQLNPVAKAILKPVDNNNLNDTINSDERPQSNHKSLPSNTSSSHKASSPPSSSPLSLTSSLSSPSLTSSTASSPAHLPSQSSSALPNLIKSKPVSPTPSCALLSKRTAVTSGRTFARCSKTMLNNNLPSLINPKSSSDLDKVILNNGSCSTDNQANSRSTSAIDSCKHPSRVVSPAIKPIRRYRPHSANSSYVKAPSKAAIQIPSEVVYEDPIFVSREELFGLKIESKGENQYEIPLNGQSIKVTVNERDNQNGEKQIDVKMNGLEKCQRANPHSISKLTAVIRSMFIGNFANLVNQRKSIRLERISPSAFEGSYSTSIPCDKLQQPVSAPSDVSAQATEESPYSEVSDEFLMNGDSPSPLQTPSPPTPGRSRPRPRVHNGASGDSRCSQSSGHCRKQVQGINPDHYVQNDAEYALVMKRSLSCGKL